MGKVLVFLLVVMIMFQVGCDKLKKDVPTGLDKEVVLTLDDDHKVFKYSENKFAPQVRSQEDLDLLKKIMRKKLDEAKAKNDLVTAANLMSAFQRGDFVRLEFLLYSFEKKKTEESTS